MKIQKFVPEQHACELVRCEAFIANHPLNEGGMLRSKRSLLYHVHENPDRSFIECQAGVKINNAWFIWPTGFLQWVAQQAEKTLHNYAA